jgi:hypothetical protein
MWAIQRFMFSDEPEAGVALEGDPRFAPQVTR